jgi:DNA-binding protein Fis
MDQRNAQAIVLEALRQSGFVVGAQGNGHQCTECCSAAHAVEMLARLAVARGEAPHKYVMTAVEKPLIEKALARTGGNQVAAARLLGLHRNSLRARMRALGIKPTRPNGLTDQTDS